MKIVIFSGTTEGRELSARLAGRGAEIAVCVATDYGREEQEQVPGTVTFTGRLTADQMADRLQGAAVCVDATHPYAVEASAAIRTACEQAGVRRLRLLRPAEPITGPHVFQVDSAAEAAARLADTHGRILLTTGAKELPAFAALPRERLYVRVLPTAESLAACEALGLPHRQICAMQGPFSLAFNRALLRQWQIAHLVTKEGGGPGGFTEKAAAAAAEGAALTVIRRPQEEGQSFDEVLALCEQILQKREN